MTLVEFLTLPPSGNFEPTDPPPADCDDCEAAR